MAHSTTPTLGVQDYFTTTLSGNVGVSDTVINLNATPTPTEGYLVIDPTNPTTREIIYYTSKGAGTVTTPDATSNSSRGLGGTTVQTHTSGTTVAMNVTAEYWNALQNGQSLAVGSFGATAFADGWVPSGVTPTAVTYNGNRNYTVTVSGVALNGVVSQGHKLKLTRTVTAPTQCTSLNGTTQFYSKTSPAGMTFTDTFSISGWIKLNSYAAQAAIISRYNGTSGFRSYINTSGQLEIVGHNAGAANFRRVVSAQSIPLNKWINVSGSLQMSNNANSKIYFDGIQDAGAAVNTGGTAPTALIQAGNLEVGSENAGASPFNGKLAQVAVYSAVIAQATIQGTISQTLAGTETSLISAYSFNNSINDLNANANNLTANGSAVATNADSPFAGGANAQGNYTAGTVEFGEIFNTTYSTNTTWVVQVPDGYSIPTSGGVSAISYSNTYNPLGWPGPITVIGYAQIQTSFSTASTSVTQILGLSCTTYIPAGRKVRVVLYTYSLQNATTANIAADMYICDGAVAAAAVIAKASAQPSGAGVALVIPATATSIWTPATSGSHTFNGAALTGNASATTIINAAANNPAWLAVELV